MAHSGLEQKPAGLATGTEFGQHGCLAGRRAGGRTFGLMAFTTGEGAAASAAAAAAAAAGASPSPTVRAVQALRAPVIVAGQMVLVEQSREHQAGSGHAGMGRTAQGAAAAEGGAAAEAAGATLHGVAGRALRCAALTAKEIVCRRLLARTVHTRTNTRRGLGSGREIGMLE
eukprot:SAG22_NODE_1893_length_3367_cov_2.848531_4_plen_172_part_00